MDSPAPPQQLHPHSTACFFNGCDKPTMPDQWKCSFHRNRGRCLVQDCNNQAYARQLCAKHGGKKKCYVEGCPLSARLANVCYKHGARNLNKKCTHEGCTKPAQFQHKCVRHGGGRKCKVDGCVAHARCGGYCCRHGREVGIVREKRPKINASPRPRGRKCLDDVKIEPPVVVFTEPFSTEEWYELDWSMPTTKCLDSMDLPWTNEMIDFLRTL
ncbi:Aste57867_598 [Aphanomyces stellatus]|uniref:Aste57867_598 protein n=1 Tax=Aphanomyces stellatus TaxID=120398 RepID=A0A485K748_9STRA|nr:hypothetical protein As57867_000597 [Aphanomyces stellatus]VFT77823.1 Aste57867_598 [Aphanomyces stellatus]